MAAIEGKIECLIPQFRRGISLERFRAILRPVFRHACSEELEELARIEKARLVAAESLDAAMHNSIASLRKMANRASVESVPASNQIHTLADFCAKQWLYLSTQVWLPPRPK